MRRSILIVGALVGFIPAAIMVLGPETLQKAERQDAIATINGRTLTRHAYNLAVESIATDKRNPINEKDKAHILRRLIEEELLVQRGLNLNLVTTDRALRRAVVAAMLQLILEQEAQKDFTSQEVADFYDKNKDFFAAKARLQVEHFFIKDDAESSRKVERAKQALVGGEPFIKVARLFGEPFLSAPPSGLLTPSKLRQYLGPKITAMAWRLKPGEVIVPQGDGGTHFLMMVKQQKGKTPQLAKIHAQVKAEMSRRHDDHALRTYLNNLYERADITLAKDAPDL